MCFVAESLMSSLIPYSYVCMLIMKLRQKLDSLALHKDWEQWKQ